MKNILISLLCICIMLGGCAPGNQADTSKDTRLSVVATIFPPYDFVRQIGADRINLSMLIPPGTESHTYEPSPGDIISIEECDIFIYAGGNGDRWVESIIQSINSDTIFISLMDIISPLTEQHTEGMQLTSHTHHRHTVDCDHSSADTEHEVEYDEHVWTSPINADIISNYICDVMCDADPENAQFYLSNYAQYSSRLKTLDESVRQILTDAKRNTIIFADRFPIRYFTEEYSINYYAPFPGCAAEVEPSPKTLMFLIDKVRNEQIPVVFYRELSNKKVAQVVCEDTDADMLLFHSCHSVTNEEFEKGITYTQIMEQNISNLKEALN